MNNTLKSLAIASLVLSLNACTSSGGGDDTSGDSCNPAEGYPNVCGDYSYTSSDISYTCTDGASGSVAGASQLVSVHLNGEVITFVNSGKQTPLSDGVTIISNTGTSGTIAKDGSFSATQRIVAEYDQLDGEVHQNTTTEGSFSGVGWEGTRTFELDLVAYDTICTYVTSFSGGRLEDTSVAIGDQQYWFSRHQADPYTSAIAATLAKGFSAKE